MNRALRVDTCCVALLLFAFNACTPSQSSLEEVHLDLLTNRGAMAGKGIVGPPRWGPDEWLLPFGAEATFWVDSASAFELVWQLAPRSDRGELIVEVETEELDARVSSAEQKMQGTAWSTSRWPSVLRLGRSRGAKRFEFSTDQVTKVRLRAEGGAPSSERGLVFSSFQVRRNGPAQFAPTAPLSEPVPEAEDSLRQLPSRPHLLLYVVDTLRADGIGVYAGQPGQTPAFDEFAADAWMFTDTLAQSSWTRASMASVMTGLPAFVHGTNRRPERLRDEAHTLAERLAEGGYQTAAWITNVNLREHFGFRQGFDHYVYREEKDATPLVEEALAWWDGALAAGARDAEEAPLFLWLHTLDPHAPYDPPSRWFVQAKATNPSVDESFAEQSLQILNDLQARRREATPQLTADLRALYDAEARTADAGFQRLLEGLEERDLLDETVVLVVSDHGEEFGEHGNWQHGRALYDESVRVPMMLRVPGAGGRRTASPVEHLDVLPTFLALAGLEVDSVLPGRDLLAPAEIRAERIRISYLHLDGSPRIAVRRGSFKAIFRIMKGEFDRHRLYDLSADPEEMQNLATHKPLLLEYFQDLARRNLALGERWQAETVELDEELERSLRALGYLQ